MAFRAKGFQLQVVLIQGRGCFLHLSSTCLAQCLSLVDTVREKSERASSSGVRSHCTLDNFSRGKTSLNSEHNMDKWEFTAQEQEGVMDAKLLTKNIRGGVLVKATP